MLRPNNLFYCQAVSHIQNGMKNRINGNHPVPRPNVVISQQNCRKRWRFNMNQKWVEYSWKPKPSEQPRTGTPLTIVLPAEVRFYYCMVSNWDRAVFRSILWVSQKLDHCWPEDGWGIQSRRERSKTYRYHPGWGEPQYLPGGLTTTGGRGKNKRCKAWMWKGLYLAYLSQMHVSSILGLDSKKRQGRLKMLFGITGAILPIILMQVLPKETIGFGWFLLIWIAAITMVIIIGGLFDKKRNKKLARSISAAGKRDLPEINWNAR